MVLAWTVALHTIAPEPFPRATSADIPQPGVLHDRQYSMPLWRIVTDNRTGPTVNNTGAR